MNILNIWGIIFEINCTTETLQQIMENFAGAIFSINEKDTTSTEIVRIIFEEQAKFQSLLTYQTKIRHGAGSQARKFFQDGTEFFPHLQKREIAVVNENNDFCVYSNNSDGLVICSNNQFNIYGFDPLKSLIVLDVIENILLSKAYSSGWLHCHASAWVKSNKRATIAIGDSGAGKTTALLRNIKMNEASYLSSDRIFLRFENGKIYAKSFPLQMNIGVGTIRSLDIPIDAKDFSPTDKIRLTAVDVFNLFSPDYHTWFEVDEVLCSGKNAIDANVYLLEDESHPFWIHTVAPRSKHPHFDCITEKLIKMKQDSNFISKV